MPPEPMRRGRRIQATMTPIRIPAPPKMTDREKVSARNIRVMKPLRAPTARIMPNSSVRSRAFMLSVFMMMMIATKNRRITNT